MNRRGFFKALGAILAAPVVAKVAAVLPAPQPAPVIMWGQQVGKSMAAVDAITAFTRAQLRETSFAMRILPPQRVG